MSDKGFTLIEMILSLFLMSIISALTLSYLVIDFNDLVIPSEYHYIQSEAIAKKETQNFSFYGQNIYFNYDGKVNQAQSISVKQKVYVIRLGFGNLRYE